MGRRSNLVERACSVSGVIYFAETGDSRIVKFGFTTNIQRRMAQWCEYSNRYGVRLRLLGTVPAQRGAEVVVRGMFRKNLVPRSEFVSDAGGNFVDWLYSTPRLRAFVSVALSSGISVTKDRLLGILRRQTVNAADRRRSEIAQGLRNECGSKCGAESSESAQPTEEQ